MANEISCSHRVLGATEHCPSRYTWQCSARMYRTLPKLPLPIILTKLKSEGQYVRVPAAADMSEVCRSVVLSSLSLLVANTYIKHNRTVHWRPHTCMTLTLPNDLYHHVVNLQKKLAMFTNLIEFQTTVVQPCLRVWDRPACLPVSSDWHHTGLGWISHTSCGSPSRILWHRQAEDRTVGAPHWRSISEVYQYRQVQHAARIYHSELFRQTQSHLDIWVPVERVRRAWSRSVHRMSVTCSCSLWTGVERWCWIAQSTSITHTYTHSDVSSWSFNKS